MIHRDERTQQLKLFAPQCLHLCLPNSGSVSEERFKTVLKDSMLIYLTELLRFYFTTDVRNTWDDTVPLAFPDTIGKYLLGLWSRGQ